MQFKKKEKKRKHSVQTLSHNLFSCDTYLGLIMKMNSLTLIAGFCGEGAEEEIWSNSFNISFAKDF